ncbi:ComEA family DNA-binding protein [Paenibacillus polymyxa]|uniref:ComEA family DNA-binding protein n=1 Tax=Paenibacillus polymyxa TaxID=1406 RepID=UPI0001E6C9E5|nr:ComEA family DNA-binding protein [Paenibacillus polymyxa]WPQ55366.1 ComEA family DNA-binding protein [Paenibacillus polymyxa]CCI70258.1 DNA polymerase III polC-type [Paenibacillus polymyxa M1]
MKRVWTGTAITLAVIGSGLILFAGGQRSEPQEEWSLLNHKVEHALAIESESIESQRSSEYTQGKHAVKEASDQTERRANVEAVDNVKHNTKQSSTGLSAAMSENSMVGNSSTVKQSDVADSRSDTAVASSDAATTSRTNTVNDSVIPSVSGEKKVNINTATAAELMELPGVGAKKAEAILNYRNQHGLFKRVNDLDRVKGIGAKMLAKMKPYVSL